MSGFTYIIIGGVLALIGSVLATLGGSKLKRTEEALSLSVPPSIEITVQANATPIPDIVVENTGQHELTNVRLSPISYVIAKEPMKVLYRLPRLSFEIAKSLKPREKITFPSNKIDFHAPAELLNDKTIKMIVMVVVFRRQLDNKRYVEIEPFITETIEGSQALFALYSDRDGVVGGPPSFVISAIKEVTKPKSYFSESNDPLPRTLTRLLFAVNLRV